MIAFQPTQMTLRTGTNYITRPSSPPSPSPFLSHCHTPFCLLVAMRDALVSSTSLPQSKTLGLLVLLVKLSRPVYKRTSDASVYESQPCKCQCYITKHSHYPKNTMASILLVSHCNLWRLICRNPQPWWSEDRAKIFSTSLKP